MWGKSGTEVIPALFSFLHYSLISQKVMNEYLQSRQIWNLRDQRKKNSLVCPHSKRVFFVYCTNRKQRLLYRTIYFLSMVHKGSLCDKSISNTGKWYMGHVNIEHFVHFHVSFVEIGRKLKKLLKKLCCEVNPSPQLFCRRSAD